MPKVDEATILKRPKKLSRQIVLGSRAAPGRLAEFHTCVSFFGPDRLDADDWDEPSLEVCMKATARF